MKKKTFKEIFINAFWDSVFLFIIALFCTLITPGCEGGNKTNTSTVLPTTPTPITADVERNNKNTAIAIANNGNATASIDNKESTDNSSQAPTSPLP